MYASFFEYRDAHKAAVNTARQLGREVGLLKAKEYNKTMFQVIGLPEPKNRYGFELRCQVIAPSEPHMAGNETIPQCAHGIDEDDACDSCDAALHNQP